MYEIPHQIEAKESHGVLALGESFIGGAKMVFAGQYGIFRFVLVCARRQRFYAYCLRLTRSDTVWLRASPLELSLRMFGARFAVSHR